MSPPQLMPGTKSGSAASGETLRAIVHPAVLFILPSDMRMYNTPLPAHFKQLGSYYLPASRGVLRGKYSGELVRRSHLRQDLDHRESGLCQHIPEARSLVRDSVKNTSFRSTCFHDCTSQSREVLIRAGVRWSFSWLSISADRNHRNASSLQCIEWNKGVIHERCILS